jgi:hypothetical protein
LLYKLSFLCSIIFIDVTTDEMGSRNGFVHTADRYGLDGWGFDYLWEHSSISAMEPCQLPVNWGLGALIGDNMAKAKHNNPPPHI